MLRGGASIFDKMKNDDLLLAFFPCVRFENQILMAFKGTANQKHGANIWERSLIHPQYARRFIRSYLINDN